VLVGTDRTSDLVVTLARGASIAGRVVDAAGLPVAGARIRVGLRRSVGPNVTIGGDVGEPAAATTDDSGSYRVFDLPPGDYVVGMAPRGLATGDTRVPGLPVSNDTSNAQGASVGYVPMYFPAAATAETATTISLAAGIDRTGVDIRTAIARFGRIDGLLSGIDGVVPPSQIQLRPRGWTTTGSFLVAQTTHAGNDGRFVFNNVPPGDYAIVARTVPPPPDPVSGAQRRPPLVWAMEDVTMAGADAHVLLRWQGGLSVSGRVTFTGLAHPPTDITVRVGIRATPASSGPALPDPVPIDADGRFTLTGVMPGDYWLTVQVPASPALQLPEWIPASAMIDARDAFDIAFQVRPNLGTPEIPVILTRDTQQIEGDVRDAGGRPVADCPIVVFSTDRQFWFPQSRRVVLRRTDTGGGLLFNLGAALPPGEYFVAAIPDLQPGEQFDSVVLAQAAASAKRISVAAGGSASVQVRLARTP
jgi:uncharacterized protein (DUF2141 family)